MKQFYTLMKVTFTLMSELLGATPLSTKAFEEYVCKAKMALPGGPDQTKVEADMEDHRRTVEQIKKEEGGEAEEASLVA